MFISTYAFGKQNGGFNKRADTPGTEPARCAERSLDETDHLGRDWVSPPTETGVHIEANFSQADVYSFEKRFNDLYLKLLSRTPCRPMAGKLTTIQYLF